MGPDRRRLVAALGAVAVVGAAMTVIVVVGGVRLPSFPAAAEVRPPADGLVAFVRWGSPDTCVAVVEPASGRERELWCGRHLDGHVTWDDGGVVVHTYGPGGQEAVTLDPADGSVVERRFVDRERRPAPHPLDEPGRRDDDTRAVAGGRGRRAWLDLVDAAGASRRLLEVEGPRGYAFVEIVWSPGGDWLAVTDTAERLLLVDAGGGEAALLAEDAAAPSWGSPRGGGSG